VKVQQHYYSDKTNYTFKLDNNFFKKLFKKPEDRLFFNKERVTLHDIIFKYKPKEPKIMIRNNDEEMLVSLSPFEIVVSTFDCHDLVYYHSPNENNYEVLKSVYILNIEKVINKLNNILEQTEISDKGIKNMIKSIYKHIGTIQNPQQYNVNYEQYLGLTEEDALTIIDDFHNNELLHTLQDYLI